MVVVGWSVAGGGDGVQFLNVLKNLTYPRLFLPFKTRSFIGTGKAEKRKRVGEGNYDLYLASS